MSTGALRDLFHRPPPSKWRQFLSEPCMYLAKLLYASRQIRPFELPLSPVRVVCLSDTHNNQVEVPSGDILIHAGDTTNSGSLSEFQAAVDRLDALPHQHKIIIGGNHELLLDSEVVHTRKEDHSARSAINWRNLIYLENEEIILHCAHGREVHVYGSPLTPHHGNWAFQYPRSRDVWSGTVPTESDILITHGPPKAHLDLGWGCDFQLEELWRIQPRLHVFGHIHEGYGVEWAAFDRQQRRFEEVIEARGGIWTLLLMFYEFIVAWLTRATTSHTMLVNTAIVGGLNNEKRKILIVVDL